MGLGHSPKITTSGLVGYWDAGNTRSYPGSGTTWTNLGGAYGNGTLTGNVTFNSGNGGSLITTGIGSASYIDCGNPTQLQMGTAITVESWVKLVNASYNGNIAQKNDNSGWRFRVNTTYAINILDRGGTNVLTTSTNIVTTGVWYNITMAGDSGGLYIYLNGSLVASGGTAFYPSGNITSGNFIIGMAQNNLEIFQGNIAIVRAYNRKLLDTELKQNFNALRGRFGI